MDTREIQQAIDRLPRQRLAYLPTPMHPCPRLSAQLGGPRLFVKRDDLTGLAFGGNKSRYLEFTLAEAVEQGADAVVLSAVVQSNHCRQLAAAAARLGLKAVVVLRQDESRMGYCVRPAGNYLLDQLFGAEIRFAPPEGVQAAIEAEMARLRLAGYRPFTGLSAVRSRVAYIQCVLELAQQGAEFGIDLQRIFIGSGSNSLAGLVAGFSLLGKRPYFVGVPQGRVGDPRKAAARVVEMAREAAGLIGLACDPDPDRILLDDRHVGPGFGVVDAPTREAVHLLARTEGIVLDPTYTGKGFAGLIAHIRQGDVGPDEDAVFVHTGGTPLIFAYGSALL